MDTTQPAYENLLELIRRQERLIEELTSEVAQLKAELAKKSSSERIDASFEAEDRLNEVPVPVLSDGTVDGEVPLVEALRPAEVEVTVEASGDEAAWEAVTVEDGFEVSAPAEQPELVAESAPESESVGLREPRRPARPQPRPDSADEFTLCESELPTLSDSYRLWNRAIAEQLLLSHDAGQDVYLAITPRTLAGAFSSLDEAGRTIEDLEQDFITAARGAYHARVIGSRGRLNTLRRMGHDGVPDCIGFLALSVLAAYRMHSDEEASGSAYYKRLAGLLDCAMAGGHPAGFDPAAFELLWLFARSWLEERVGARLVVRGIEAGIRRYVALPLAHVPLRCLDIEKLPSFFDWAGYPPRGRVPAETLQKNLLRWDTARSVLTPTGASALADERLAAVLAQTASELESWDGSLIDSLRSRSAVVEVLLEVVRRQPKLYYLPRRPSGFPGRFDDGAHIFESSDEGWYDPVPIRPEDGFELKTGFHWSMQDGRMQTILRRQASAAVPLAPSQNASGFMSSRGLLRGVPCAVLCSDDAVSQVSDYLSFIASGTCRPINHPGIPEGWSLFLDVKPVRAGETPSGLKILSVDADVEIMPAGGVRLGRRWAWLEGAPPRILVSGLEPGASVLVDGSHKTVGDDGTLQMNGSLQQVGRHQIEAGRVRRTIEIVAPRLALPTDAVEPETAVGRRRSVNSIALPRGQWMVLGATPGQFAIPFSSHSGGSVVRCRFEPIWAIHVGAGRGAEVLCLSRDVPPMPSHVSTWSRAEKLRTLQWAEALYQTIIRRPTVRSLFHCHDNLELNQVWQRYRVVARGLKRQLNAAFRRGRR